MQIVCLFLGKDMRARAPSFVPGAGATEGNKEFSSVLSTHNLVIITCYNNMMSDALFIYSQRYIITSCILLYTHGVVSCAKGKSQEKSPHIIRRYYNIPLVSLSNAKILKSGIIIWVKGKGAGYFSLCTVYGHPVTSSQLTSVCAVAQGHPVTSSQMTSSICQRQSRSGHYQVLHQGLVQVYISSISQDGGLLFQAEWQGTAGAVLVCLGVTDCAW